MFECVHIHIVSYEYATTGWDYPTVLYGHNTASVLRDTQSLKIGDELELDTQEGFQFIYRFDHDKNVKPNDTSVFSHTTTPQLTLITCNGRFNSHRRLMTFTLTSVRKLQ